MAKLTLVKGDHIVAKKWSGEEFIGIFEYGYQDGSHCVVEVSTNKRFNVKAKDVVRYTNEDEEKEIKRIIKERKIVLKETPNNDTATTTNDLDALLASTEEEDSGEEEKNEEEEKSEEE